MKSKSDASAVTEAELVMTRLFDAPREVVWAAFTDPKHVMRWYGGHGFSNPVCEMDVRPGGLWRHVMRTPDGQDYPQTFVFVEVIKPQKLSWQSVDQGKQAAGELPTCLMTVTLEELGARTKWQLVARFASAAERERASKLGFSEKIMEGSERLNELAKTLLSKGETPCAN